jgi:hypothetical protein
MLEISASFSFFYYVKNRSTTAADLRNDRNLKFSYHFELFLLFFSHISSFTATKINSKQLELEKSNR